MSEQIQLGARALAREAGEWAVHLLKGFAFWATLTGLAIVAHKLIGGA